MKFWCRPDPKRGFTIIELIVVLGIIAILLGLLFPAVQWARRSARDTVCKNNIRQIGLSLEQLRNSKPRIPEWDHDLGTAGGWSVAILPYVDPVYAANVYENLDLNSLPPAAQVRPSILTCPLALDYENDDEIERAHYILSPRDHRRDWFIADAQIDNQQPWLIGMELASPFQGLGPHRRGFYQYWRNGQLNYAPSNSTN